MGYNVKPGVVTRYHETLEQIKTALDSGRSASFSVEHPAHLTKLRDQLHWFLRCAKLFTDECDGRYADLRDRAKVHVNWDTLSVEITAPNVAAYSRPVAANPNERAMLQLLEQTDEHMLALNFVPSDDYLGDEWLTLQAAKRGFNLVIEENDEFLISKGADPKSYIAIRRQKKQDAWDMVLRRGQGG